MIVNKLPKASFDGFGFYFFNQVINKKTDQMSFYLWVF